MTDSELPAGVEVITGVVIWGNLNLQPAEMLREDINIDNSDWNICLPGADCNLAVNTAGSDRSHKSREGRGRSIGNRGSCGPQVMSVRVNYLLKLCVQVTVTGTEDA
jgi:hypothetical protein